MNDIEKLNTVFQQIYDELNNRIKSEGKNLHNVKLFKQSPETPVLPHIQMEFMNSRLNEETLDKNERKWNLLIEVNIYAQDLAKVPRRQVTNDIQNYVFGYLFDEYGFNCPMNQPIPNLDTKIHRVFMRFTAQYDIDSGVISRN